MKLVPFILAKKKVNQFTITSVNVFLSYAGKAVWKTEESGFVSLSTILQDYCEPNGIFIEQSYLDKTKQIAYLKVNPEKTNLAEFYTWEESLSKSSKPECWRRFYFIQDAEHTDWWSPQGLTEAEIQDFGNIEQLASVISQYFKDT